MARYFAGIDGGQSSTAAVIFDDYGALLGRGSAGPSDHVDEPATSQRAAQAVKDAHDRVDGEMSSARAEEAQIARKLADLVLERMLSEAAK